MRGASKLIKNWLKAQNSGGPSRSGITSHASQIVSCNEGKSPLEREGRRRVEEDLPGGGGPVGGGWSRVGSGL